VTIDGRPARRLRIVAPTRVTLAAVAAIFAVMSFTAAFLIARYPALPFILPVHFNRAARANGWQFKTYARVLMPVFVQLALTLTLGAIGTLLLSRSRNSEHSLGDSHGRVLPSIAGGAAEVAAATAAEAVALFALIWVAFQAYAALALVAMWQRGRDGLGNWYTTATAVGIALSIVVAIRAQRRLGRPEPRDFVAEHWRLGRLYRNALDPALFVPTRDGSGWTLNFGRPVAAALMAVILFVGIIGPTVILGLMLR
jgi:uncharacterized membrane protein